MPEIKAAAGGGEASWREPARAPNSAGLAPLLPHIVTEWPRLAWIGVLTVCASGMLALQPLPAKFLVDVALQGGAIPEPVRRALDGLGFASSPVTLIGCAAVFSIGFFLAKAAADFGISSLWAVAGRAMVSRLATAMFERLQRLTPVFHSRQPLGESLSRLTSDTWCVYTLAADVMMSPLEKLLTTAAVGVVGWRLDPQLTIVMFVLAPAMALSTRYFGGRLKHRARLGREAQSRLLSHVHQTLESIPVVQAFGGEMAHRDRFETLADDAISVSRKGALLNSAYGFVNGLITTAGATVILYFGANRVLSGALSVGSLLVFLAYVRNMESVAEQLLKTYGKFKEIEASAERVAGILSCEEMVRESPEAIPVPPPRAGISALRLEDVVFGYRPDTPVLKKISFEVATGEVLAVIGSTGSGKSTLVSLLCRLVDPWQGRVLVNGADLRQLQVASLRSHISVVLQEPFLLPVSIAENIARGRPGASRAEIEAAARAANADEFIRRLPEAYDTVLAQRGSSLSGGERQRIAIARALLRDAPVLILDEPTASLDSRSELAVMDALDRLMEGRSTVIISHRMSSIRRANHVVVLEHGEVVEAGRPEDLQSSGGRFERFHTLQLESPGRRG